MMDIVYLVIAGLVSGIVGGMGMGGGTLLIPILSIFLGFSQKSAQGINLLVFIPMSIVAIIIHIKNKLIDFKVGVPIIISGIIFSVIGSIIANGLSNNNLRVYFGVFLLLVGVFQFIQTILNSRQKKVDRTSKKFKINIFVK
jgi:uncharacterized membrane protein YfcA